MQPATIDTSIALVERDEQGLIRLRVKPGAKLCVKGFKEVLEGRSTLADGQPACVVALLQEDMDFDIQILNVDHYEKIDATAFTRAFAIVSQSSLYIRLYELYAAFFKPAFPVQVFSDEDSALGWLKGYQT